MIQRRADAAVTADGGPLGCACGWAGAGAADGGWTGYDIDDSPRMGPLGKKLPALANGRG
jgi:hypothetical protein